MKQLEEIEKELGDYEKRYGMSSTELLNRQGLGDFNNSIEFAEWASLAKLAKYLHQLADTEKTLAKFEKQFGMTTTEFLEKQYLGGTENKAESVEWVSLAQNAESLRQLVRGENSIRKLRESSLTGLLDRLIEKAIENNEVELQLENISFNESESSVFQKIARIKGLTKLAIRNCRLQTIPKEIVLLQNLEELSLNSNIITEIPDYISELQNLRKLEIHANRITKISDKMFELKKLTSLDLRTNKIQELPIKIGQLKNLTWLGISMNLLQTLPAEIAELTRLENLRASHNMLVSLPSDIQKLAKLCSLKINNNKFKEFPIELTQLQNLEHLEIGNEETIQSDTRMMAVSSFTKQTGSLVSGNSLEFIPEEICALLNLKELNAENGGIRRIPSSIGQLENLQTLNLRSNNILELPDQITEMENLEYLNISFNPIRNLPEKIGKLKKLKYLILRKTLIDTFPRQIDGLASLEMLDVVDCSIPIPPEISLKTDKPNVILNYYFQHLPAKIDQSNDDDNSSKELVKYRHLDEAKLLILGQGSVGKTSILKRLVFDDFDFNEKKTEGIAIHHINVAIKDQKNEHEEYTANLNVWDFGGQEIMHATHQFFLTKRSLYLLVLDSRIGQEENRVEYWLKIIQSYGGDSPILIVGNKTDQSMLDIDRTGLQKKYTNIVGIIQTSAATGAGILELRNAILQQVGALPHVRDLLPETWLTAKIQLENIGRNENYLTFDEYLSLCRKNGIIDSVSQRTLISFLHDLGVVLYFQDDPRLQELGILNPQWVTNGVYKILNSHALFQNKGILTISMLDDILNLPEYPRGKRLFIVDMMKKFELCYDIETDKIFLVPDLLPKDETYTGTWSGALAFQYHYNVLPSNIISRFIVRMNAYIHKTIWRSGVVLAKGGNTALVKADIEEKKIYVWVNGDEPTRRDLLSAIRAEFETIHKTIVKLEAREKVPVPTHPEIVVDYEHLLNLERLGEPTFIPEGLHEHVNVRELLNGIAPESERQERVKKLREFTIEKVASIPIQSALPPIETKPQPKVLVAIKNILALPKPIGRFIFDVFGRHDSADTSSIIMGWIFIALIILLLKGFIQTDAVINMFKDIWRFFFPVK